MPVGIIIVGNAEVGTADGFEIVGQAGMADAEVVGRQIGGFRHLVKERCIGVADDLPVGMVFHHDQEHVVELWDLIGIMIVVGESRRGQQGGRNAECHD